ncbi:HAD hydrolase family protein [Butyricicoccus pullicaecorum]|nr:HAD hydrolase family protein [Butyricicoccus pullicaecorum]
MKYRLVALDLDGTLLNSQKDITPATCEALTWAKAHGIHVVLSTGRIVGEAAEFARQITCDDLMVTAGGGRGYSDCVRRAYPRKLGYALRDRRAGRRRRAESAGACDDLRGR